MPRNAVSEALRVGLGGVDALPVAFLVCAKIPVNFNHVLFLRVSLSKNIV